MAIYGVDCKGRTTRLAAPIGDNLLFLGYFLFGLLSIIFFEWIKSSNSGIRDDANPLAPFFLSPLLVAIFYGMAIVFIEVVSQVKLSRLGARRLPDHVSARFVETINREAKASGLSKAPPVYWLPSIYSIGARVLGGFRPKIVITGGLFAYISRSDADALYILRHEMAHIRNRDSRFYISVALAFIVPLGVLVAPEYIPAMIGSLAITSVVAVFLLRRREYLADAAAMNGSTSGEALTKLLSKSAHMETGLFHPRVERRLKALTLGSPVLRTNPWFLAIAAYMVLSSLVGFGSLLQSASLRGNYELGYLLRRLLLYLISVLPFMSLVFEASKGWSKKASLTSIEIPNDNLETVAALCVANGWWWALASAVRFMYLLHPSDDPLLFHAIRIGAMNAIFVAVVWLVAGFALVRCKGWARGLATGLAVASIFWHVFELTRQTDLVYFGSYGEVALSDSVCVPIVMLSAITTAVAICVMLMGRRTRLALSFPTANHRLVHGFAGAALVVLVVGAMAIPELGTMSLWNERTSQENAKRLQIMNDQLQERLKHPAQTEGNGLEDSTGDSGFALPEDDAIVHVSEGVALGMQMVRTSPNYPSIARDARIQGVVMMKILVSKEGVVQHAELVSGHPLLAPSALETVKTWRFKPYLLNGEPTRFETAVRVNFTLPARTPSDQETH